MSGRSAPMSSVAIVEACRIVRDTSQASRGGCRAEGGRPQGVRLQDLGGRYKHSGFRSGSVYILGGVCRISHLGLGSTKV